MSQITALSWQAKPLRWGKSLQPHVQSHIQTIYVLAGRTLDEKNKTNSSFVPPVKRQVICPKSFLLLFPEEFSGGRKNKQVMPFS